jgi:ABC-type transport system involved in cytochrome bd biosynthesis fused ATPase/permease subunit
VQKSTGGSFRASFRDAKEKELSLPFEPITLAFQDLHYYVPNPAGSGELALLKGIYGVFRPGVLTALMGASGAGKVWFLPAHGTI